MNPILSKLSFMQAVRRGLNRTDFMELRQEVLQGGLSLSNFCTKMLSHLIVIFRSLAELLRAAETAASTKSFIYRCINLFVSSLVSYDKVRKLMLTHTIFTLTICSQSIQIKYCINNHIAHSLISRSQTCGVLWAISSHHCLYQPSNTSNNEIEYQTILFFWELHVCINHCIDRSLSVITPSVSYSDRLITLILLQILLLQTLLLILLAYCC